MASILIVEDEAAIASLMKMALSSQGHVCTTASDGSQGADLIEKGNFDLALLDVMVPEITGFELLPMCIDAGIPAIFITAVGEVEKRVMGLKMGADDYIVKPFAIDELLARVDVVLRRAGNSDKLYEIDGVRIDPKAMRVTRDGEEVALTHIEYEILLLLVRNPNIAFYRETIYQRIWGGDMAYGSKTVDLHIQRLRKKTGLGCIKAVNKVGYRLDGDVTVTQP